MSDFHNRLLKAKKKLGARLPIKPPCEGSIYVSQIIAQQTAEALKRPKAVYNCGLHWHIHAK